MTKILLKYIPYAIVMRCYYYWYRFQKRSFNKQLKKEGYRILNQIDLSQYKKSDKLFVIGSGYSLNSITKNQWDEINRNDKFGFNFSFLNKDHIPTFYSCEAVKRDNPNEFGRSEMGELFYNLYKSRKDQYSKVIKIIGDIEENRKEHFENYGRDFFDDNLFIINTVNGVGSTESQMIKLIETLRKKKVFNVKKYLDEVFKFRATVSMAISFGVNLGYKEIILCGIDLSDPRYFFENKEKYPNLPEFYFTNKSKIHLTLQKDEVFAPIDIVVKVLKSHVCDQKGIRLSVQNPNSALAQHLPVYQFEN